MNELANTSEGNLSVLQGLAAEAQLYARSAALNLLQLGRVLTEAKPLVGHGAWMDWVRENAKMSVRTAQQYMQAYAEFGVNQRIAELGSAKIIRLLPMPEEERERLLSEKDVSAMSTRELDEAIRLQKEELREEALEEAKALLDKEYGEALEQERLARAEAEKEAREMRHALEKGAVPPDVAERLKELDESEKHFAELAQRLAREKAALEGEKKALAREIEEQNELLEEQQEAMNQAQVELLNLRSAQARGEDGLNASEELTLDVFTGAVREFMGVCARMPYMSGRFAGMPQKEKSAWEELIRTMDGWMTGARQALKAQAVEGGVIVG